MNYPTNSGENHVLHVKGLTKVYGGSFGGTTTKALNGLNLDVEAGEFMSIMGPSGSGKTTLLNLLAGLDKPTSGELYIAGQEVSRLKSGDMALFRRKNLGFVFQDFNLLDTLTVAENVALPLTLDGHKGKVVVARVESALDELGMLEFKDRYPYEVSGGQQQRTAVARAVVHQPSLILADEPTGNLDSGSAATLLQLLSRLNTERKATILMVTHDPFAASHSNRVVFIKDGQVFSRLDRALSPDRGASPNGASSSDGASSPGQGPSRCGGTDAPAEKEAFHSAASRRDFFQEILNTLGVLEGTR